MFEYVLSHARGRRVLVDQTASPENGGPIDVQGELTRFSFYPWPPDDLRELALGHDVILVCGGNTAKLGFLPGSACPHYDGEERRRPVYTELVAGGFPPELALDDAAAARYDGAELKEVVVSSSRARGYLVGPDGETELPVRVL